MSANGKPKSPIDLAVFERNLRQFTAEQFAPYHGKQVAYSADGTRIVAAADTDEELDAILARLGIGTDEVVFGYVDDPNVGQF
jgi:hypothetical protein